MPGPTFWGWHYRRCPAGEPDEPGGLGGADAEQAHHLTTRQRAAVPVQFGDKFSVGTLPVRVTTVRLVRRQCS